MGKRKLIVAGDSFCEIPEGWPSLLAEKLNIDLMCQTDGGGQPWWRSRMWLNGIPDQDIANCDLMVILHTNATRIPTSNRSIGMIDHSKPPTNELERAINLYRKYLEEDEFLHWAQAAWFKEVNERWGHLRLLHLHCFPWSVPFSDCLAGVNVTTNLAALSLNELGVDKLDLFNDLRGNHFNENNNRVLATALHNIVRKYQPGKYELPVDMFEQKTTRWFNWF